MAQKEEFLKELKLDPRPETPIPSESEDDCSSPLPIVKKKVSPKTNSEIIADFTKFNFEGPKKREPTPMPLQEYGLLKTRYLNEDSEAENLEWDEPNYN